jgi:hypothetical protein
MRWLPCVLLFSACTAGEIAGFAPEETGPRPDAGVTPAVGVIIRAPSERAELPRDYLNGEGEWVARVDFSAEVALPAARIDWAQGGTVVGSGQPPDYAFSATLPADGPAEWTAIARDGGGREIGRARVGFRIMPPTASSGCLAQLDALGVDYVEGPAGRGIATPVTVTLPLNGMVYKSGTTPRKTLYLDCQLALSLWRTADLVKRQGIVAIQDYGIYNYRCINQSVQPPCPGSSLSQHAFAMAIDIAALEKADGTRYIVDQDWIIDALPDGEDTCTVSPAAGDKNQLLHQLLCQWHDLEVYRILLTPNYNAAHRNHFHVDLTPGTGSWVGKAPTGGLDFGPDDE